VILPLVKFIATMALMIKDALWEVIAPQHVEPSILLQDPVLRRIPFIKERP
jgi:hypothetical protein